MYKTIELLKPYFFSIREINNTLSLDIKIPVKWGYESVLIKYENVKVKIQDKNNERQLMK